VQQDSIKEEGEIGREQKKKRERRGDTRKRTDSFSSFYVVLKKVCGRRRAIFIFLFFSLGVECGSVRGCLEEFMRRGCGAACSRCGDANGGGGSLLLSEIKWKQYGSGGWYRKSKENAVFFLCCCFVFQLRWCFLSFSLIWADRLCEGRQAVQERVARLLFTSSLLKGKKLEQQIMSCGSYVVCRILRTHTRTHT
jgi:hypothetical protein